MRPGLKAIDINSYSLKQTNALRMRFHDQLEGIPSRFFSFFVRSVISGIILSLSLLPCIQCL